MIRSDKSWRIDKHIPVAVIIVICAQVAGFIWYAAKVDAIVKQVPEIDGRLRMVETTRFTDRDAESLSKTVINEVKIQLAPMIERLSSHSKDIDRNTQDIKAIQNRLTR